MKQIITFLITMAFVTVGYAQSFNYQAVVRNNAGNIIANQTIGVQIKILQGSASGTTLYTETHIVTSNANGVISLAVGAGTTTDTFSTINWSSQNYWLEIAADITGGTTYSVIGSSQLLSVPYANYASSSGDKVFSTTANITSNASGTIATDDFVFGSSQLDDIGGNNDDNVKMYFDKSKGAFRAGSTLNTMGDATTWNAVNTGDYSVAMGRYSFANGTAATAFGTANSAGGENAFTAGFNNLASRPSTIALGADNSVSGFYAVGIGRGSQATSYGQHTIGLFSEGFFSTDNTYVATDPLFVVGNGTSDAARSNALVMRKNGNTTLNGQLTIDGDNTGAGTSYTLPAQDGTANQVMSTDGSGVLSWINTPSAADNLGNHQATQDIFLQDNYIRLRGVGDTFHGMGWYGATSFDGTTIDGPIVTGYSGGGLGSSDETNNRLALKWDNNRSVTISEAYTLPNTDGTANQVMQTNGSGAVSWVNIPADGDSDATNEIELPVQAGQSGKLLTTDGTNPSWTSNVAASSVTTDALTVNNLPAFSADLNGSQSISGAGTFFAVGDWRTSTPGLPAHLYDNGNHFNETTGEFTAPYNGFYYFTAQIRFDNITTGWMRLLFAVNGLTSLDSGLHALADGESGNRFQTLNIGGVLKLNANDKVTVVANSATDDAWSIEGESGFNGYLISRF